MKKQIKITETIIKELDGTDISKYLLSIGLPNKNKKNDERN